MLVDPWTPAAVGGCREEVDEALSLFYDLIIICWFLYVMFIALFVCVVSPVVSETPKLPWSAAANKYTCGSLKDA